MTLGKRSQKLRQFLFNAGLFIRFPTLGATIIIALLGAVSVTTTVSAGQFAGVLLGAIAYHNFAYVLNDLVDLPLDRTDPRRAQFPLVRGAVSPRQGFIFVLLQIPLMLAVTFWLGGGARAYLALAASFVFMAIYDVWGKRCLLPPLTDLAQGIGWGCLALWSAALMPGDFTRLTWVLFAYLILFIMLLNGLHGSLRDLANDYKQGVRSTAIFLGVRSEGEDSLTIPRPPRQYATILQVALTATIFIPFFGNALNYTWVLYLITLVTVIILCLASWRLLFRALDLGADRAQMLATGALHLLSLFGTLVALFLFRFPWWLQIVVLSVFLIPFLSHSWIRSTLRWVLRGKRADSIAASDFTSPDSDTTETTTLSIDSD